MIGEVAAARARYMKAFGEWPAIIYIPHTEIYERAIKKLEDDMVYAFTDRPPTMPLVKLFGCRVVRTTDSKITVGPDV